MNQDLSQRISLLDPDEIARSREPLERSWTLPPAAYTDARIFEAERKTIFAHDWICVARADQLPNPGDYVCIDLLEQPIVVTRSRDEKLNAFSRVCLHRAMPVAEGSGNATRFVCPYHNWTYELDGQLRSAPMMGDAEGFDAGKCRLPGLRLEIWNGFVFVNRDPDAPDLAPQLAGLAKLIENYDFGKLVVAATTEFDSPWNWKILVENFMEAYHHIGTHKTTFQPVYPARDSMVEDNDGAPWTFLRMPGNSKAEAEVDAQEGPAMFPKLNKTEQAQLLAMNVFPTLLFAVSATGGFWYQLEPSGHDTMRLRIHFLLPSEFAEKLDDDTRAGTIEVVRAIHTEDIEANEGPWRGLHAALTSQGRLSTFEKAIWQLNQLWLDRLKPFLGNT
jgi:phenylpropionate dioxygenase-like ring-hydroxylating dioxygenase large terminal subunit